LATDETRMKLLVPQSYWFDRADGTEAKKGMAQAIPYKEN